VVAHQDIDYKAPAFYGDTLEVTTRISGSGAAKIEFLNEVKNQDGKLVAVARTVLVCVERNLKPRQIPQELRTKLKLA